MKRNWLIALCCALAATLARTATTWATVACSQTYIIRVDKEVDCTNECTGGTNDGTWCVDDNPCTGGGGCSVCGSSWDSAFKYLQDALRYLDEASISNREIWVADATYYPDEGSAQTDNDRSATFRMIDGVHIYGGFDGYSAGAYAETTCASRSVRKCSGGDYDGFPCEDAADCTGGYCSVGRAPAILSGEIGSAGISDNSYHVVTYDDPTADVTLDGFVIMGGNADGSGTNENQGGALNIRRASKFCYFGSNDGTSCTSNANCTGGGTCNPEFCLAGGPTVRNCLFKDNEASDHAAVNDHAASTTYDNCVFRDNVAAKGAGLLVDNGGATITDCLFDNNATDGSPNEGGGLWIDSRAGTWGCPSSPAITVTDSIFDGNSVGTVSGTESQGGALWAGADTDLTLDSCDFLGNLSGKSTGGPLTWNYGNGAAIHSEAAKLTVDNCTFDSNSTLKGTMTSGGTVWIEDADDANFIDCKFVNNTVSGLEYNAGGGIWLDSGSLRVDASTFLGNSAGSGGVASFYNDSDATFANCTFVGNISAASNELAGGSVFVTLQPRAMVSFEALLR